MSKEKEKDKKISGNIDEDKLNDRFNSIERLIRNLKASIDSRYFAIEKRLDDLSKSQKFISDQYEAFRKIMDNLMTDNSKLRNENAQLKLDMGQIWQSWKRR